MINQQTAGNLNLKGLGLCELPIVLSSILHHAGLQSELCQQFVLAEILHIAVMFSLHVTAHNECLSATTISIFQIIMGTLISNPLWQFLLHYIVQAVLLSPLPPSVCFQEGLLLDSCDEQCAFG